MEPLPATFYGDIDDKNPVIATFDNEIKELLGFMRKLQRTPPGEAHQRDHQRGSSTLFHIWVKYKPRLPDWYYQEKLLKVGDSLVQIREYKLALFQCYERYLEQFCAMDINEITDVDQFKSTFFPNGIDDKKAGLTFHALQGRFICIYQLVKTSDAKLQNQESVKKCLRVLSFLQLIMEVVLPQEHLCWLVFNGTLHIYTICRHLMTLGHSSEALEFLLWASICMESSVPLLSAHYLTWRATLYTAVCQCYFDCQAGIHGEVFARRALGKISELSQLENMSDSLFNEKTKRAFTESTLKMAVMIFKRAVFESRRKPKSMLRPKLKSNLKDAEKLPWPRTNTERLLVEMFENNAAQFLAILEALTDSNRRLLQAGPPVPDEPEIYDVIAELFFAGIDILSGGGYKVERGTQGNPQIEMCKLLVASSLLELAVEEKNTVSADAVVKFLKLAFSYEHWDVFDALIAPLYAFLDVIKQNKLHESIKWKKEEMDLRILLAAEPLLSGKRHKHCDQIKEDRNNIVEIPNYLQNVGLHGDIMESWASDDYVTLAETLYSCVCNSIQDNIPDTDIVIGVILLLWQKCKTAVQRINTVGMDGSRFVQKCEVHSKWIYILCLIYEVMQHSNIEIDPIILGEAALRIAGIAESMADTSMKSGKNSDWSHEKVYVEMGNQRSKSLFLKKHPVTQLMFAYKTLDKAIIRFCVSHSEVAAPFDVFVSDHYISMLGGKIQHAKDTAEQQSNSSKSFVNNVTMMDLQLELIVAQHRVSVKVLNQLQVHSEHLRSSKTFSQSQRSVEFISFHTESEILDKINKNKLLKAIFFMQKAQLFNNKLDGSPDKLLEDSQKLIRQAEAEEYAVYMSCIKPELKKDKTTLPPPPILVSRTEKFMVFKLTPFKSDIKVSWYSLFGRMVTGSNLKVRLNDHNLPGTGEKIPATGNNLLEVKGLKVNEKYIFAVAAYSSDGSLIGDSIGETTKPILASSLLSAPAAWAYLAQSAYHVGNYNVAKKACSLLWNYFVLPPVSESNDLVLRKSKESYISQMRLCQDAISNSSPILLQLFLGTIFMSSDMTIKEQALFCDTTCDSRILRNGQMCRIAECEKLLVALDVSTLLSDASYALQAVIQCYGLIAPVMYHRIPSVPVVQILIKCLAVLQEIPSSTWQKKQAGITEGVLHMTACIVYYVAKVLRSWEEYEVAVSVIEMGKKLLDMTEKTSSIVPASQSKSTWSDDTERAKDADDKAKVHFPKKYQKKKMLIAEKVSEQLSVLEHNLLKLTKSIDSTALSGQEDPILLHYVVTCWTPNAAFREIMKFKKKSRFLEFFVQLMHRVVCEEKFQKVLEWTTVVFDYLKRRNEALLGNKPSEEMSDVPVAIDSFRRYTTVLVEYQKVQATSTIKHPKKTNVPEKIKVRQIKNSRNLELHRLSAEELQRKAFTTLLMLLTPIVGRYIKRKRLIQATIEEMPWRAKMNLLVALTHFSLLKKKLSQLCSEDLMCSLSINSYSILDPELFTLHHAGTVVMVTETNSVDEQLSSTGHLHPSLKLDLPPDTKITDSFDYSEPSTIRSDMDTPRTQMTNDTETAPTAIKEQAKLNRSSVILLNHLGKVFLHLKRAVVLAHRGGHWTLLQNVCRVLWNLVLELQLITKGCNTSKGLSPITGHVLNNETWMPFYFAADTILDMIVCLQNTGSVKVFNESDRFCVPSCIGGIADDEGGSSLIFEYPLDDVNVTDMRWICNLVLNAIEVLYHMKKWEGLVHIAVQFNLLTHERFTEQVTPLLVHAQRMLVGRVCQIKVSNSSELRVNATVKNSDEKLHCRNDMGKQLYFGKTNNKILKNPESDTDQDQRGHITHSDGKYIKALTSVPVDVMDTFTCFHDSLQKSKYSSRALKHSRKLLTLFLAYGQGLNAQKHSNPYTSHGKVGFSAGATQAHRPVPPDLSEEEFLSAYSIESKAIPPSHLSVVIASYDKTIDILHSNKQQSLKAQALHELGNLHLYAGNTRAAFKCWCQALDETLNMSDALNSWQELDSSPGSMSNGRSKDYSEKFLSRAGIWGCLLAAVIAAKMSRYVFISNVRKKTECCLLSALLFKSLFYASLPHPYEDLDYALYEIGEGCEISELIPGIDLFSDRHRADVITVVSSLYFLISELHSVAQNLKVLPLFTLYQYFVTFICRDPIRCVEGRLLKVKVLTDLHLYSEACHELFLLNSGTRIPRRPHEGFIPAGKPLAPAKFSSSKTLLCSENLQALEEVLTRKSGASLLSVCDQATMNKLVLAKTYFILKLSSTINAIPEVLKKPGYYVTEESAKHQDAIGSKDEEDAQLQLASKQDLTIPRLKDILLNEAERRVTSILQDLEMKYQCQLSECSAVELKMVIDAKCQLSEVAQQRCHTAVSVAMAFSALKLLQEAKILKAKSQRKSENISPSFSQRPTVNEQINEPTCKSAMSILSCEYEARERLSMCTWLKCHFALVTVLAQHVHGIALNDQDMPDCSTLITEGIVASEALKDDEMQAQFMLQAVLLDIQEGHPKNGVRLLLENIISLLQGKHFISPVAHLTLAQSLLLSADFMEINDNGQLFWTNQLNTFTLAHKFIVKQLTYFGENIRHDVTHPALLPPFKNIYLPHICLLAKARMRIGHTLTLQICSFAETSLNPSQLLPSLDMYDTALQLCRTSSFREYDLEAELLFLKGRTERLMLIFGDHTKYLAVNSLSEAINVSRYYDQNFSLIRKSYLEIALVYLHISSLDTIKTKTVSLRTLKTPESKLTSKGKIEKKTSEKDDDEKTLSSSEFYRLLAWIAIRAATQVAEVVLKFKQLLGERNSAVQTLKPEIHEYIPTFACMDLLETFKKHMSDDCQKPYGKQEKPDKSIRDGKQDGQENLPLEVLSWVHVIHYHNQLMRLKNMLAVPGFPGNTGVEAAACDTLYTSVFDNGFTVRYAEMHLFLKTYLYSYSTCCVDNFPPELLWGLEQKPTCFYIQSKSNSEGKEHRQMTSLSVRESQGVYSGSKFEPLSDEMAIKAVDEELCVQWYFTTLGALENENAKVLLMYAHNKQNISVKDPGNLDPAKIICGSVWISLSCVLSLHEKLCVMRQKAEISLHSVTDASISGNGEKQKRSARTAKNKPDLKPVMIAPKLQTMVQDCCSEVQALLTSSSHLETITQAPFDITLASLIKLERVFDLTHGCMLMKGSLLDWTVSQFT